MKPSDRGTLFLVVGPSGVGKDSLLEGAAGQLADDERFAFPRRVITRAADAGGEDHIAVSDEEFAARARAGAFILSWAAHGYRYGIPDTVLRDVERGRNVVVNVSRGVVEEARDRLSPIAAIHVTVSPEVLARRLRERGRESAPEIARRLERATAYAVPDTPDTFVLENDGELSESVETFVALLRAIARNGSRSPENQAPVTGPGAAKTI
jgi:phosphonate metabolism protein PhnN/1,5-bisphosphokinase (PRPP-forming)